MIVYRLVKQVTHDSLKGTGAAKYGGRWNAKGVPAVYTAESPELALLEILVNVPLALLPASMELLTLHITRPELIFRVPDEQMPEGWNCYPHRADTVEFGTRILERGTWLGFAIPTAVTGKGRNVVLNPRHSHWDTVKLKNREPFPIDQRITFQQ